MEELIENFKKWKEGMEINGIDKAVDGMVDVCNTEG